MNLRRLGGRVLRAAGLMRSIMTGDEARAQRLGQLRAEVPWLFFEGAGKRVLYVGATPQRFQMGKELHEAGYKITLLEAHKPFADFYEGHPWLAEVIHGDVRNIGEIAGERMWDVVVWWHGPEHIEKARLAPTVEALEGVAERGVVLGCPWGVNQQGMMAGNPYSVHEAHLDVGDLEILGYTTRTLGRKSDPSTWCHILAWKGRAVLVSDEVVVYTAVFGGYDAIIPTMFPHDGRHVCFTDVEVSFPTRWEVRQIKRRFDDPQLEARMYKLLAHQWFPRASYSVWHDGNMSLKIRPDQAVQYLGAHDVAMFAHPKRACVYEEARVILEMKKALGFEISIGTQAKEYKRRGYPAQHGLAATGLVVRRHTEAVARFNDAWWSELARYSNRDQMSVNYVLWRLGMDYAVISGNVFENEIVDYRAHGIGSG